MPSRIGMEKRKFKTVSEFNNGFGSMGFIRITQIIWLSLRLLESLSLGFGGENGPDKIQRFSDDLFASSCAIRMYGVDIFT